MDRPQVGGRKEERKAGFFASPDPGLPADGGQQGVAGGC